MITTKMRLAAAALAVISLAGVGAANAQPWNDRGPARHGYHDSYRGERHDRFADHVRLRQILRSHDMRMIGAPRALRGDRFAVRVEDRFGRIRMVQVNTYNGRVIRL